MLEPIESAYFNWLCAKVMNTEARTPTQKYYSLLRELQNTEFVWKEAMDVNRSEDGLDLRREFFNETHAEVDPLWEHIGCSVLEMIIAFTRRCEFATGVSVRDWFWEIMDNLELKEFNDSARFNPDDVGDILYRFVWRLYDYNGRGGMFPIDDSPHDQRKVEIWYQFCDYIVAKHYV